MAAARRWLNRNGPVTEGGGNLWPCSGGGGRRGREATVRERSEWKGAPMVVVFGLRGGGSCSHGGGNCVGRRRRGGPERESNGSSGGSSGLSHGGKGKLQRGRGSGRVREREYACVAWQLWGVAAVAGAKGSSDVSWGRATGEPRQWKGKGIGVGKAPSGEGGGPTVVFQATGWGKAAAAKALQRRERENVAERERRDRGVCVGHGSAGVGEGRAPVVNKRRPWRAEGEQMRESEDGGRRDRVLFQTKKKKEQGKKEK